MVIKACPTYHMYCLSHTHNQSLIHLKETEKVELERKIHEATQDLEDMRNDVSKL